VLRYLNCLGNGNEKGFMKAVLLMLVLIIYSSVTDASIDRQQYYQC
jgi:hypothetical protein